MSKLHPTTRSSLVKAYDVNRRDLNPKVGEKYVVRVEKKCTFVETHPHRKTCVIRFSNRVTGVTELTAHR